MNQMMSLWELLPRGLDTLLSAAILSTAVACVLWFLLAMARVRHPAVHHRAWLGLALGMLLLPCSLLVEPWWNVSLLDVSALEVPASVVAIPADSTSVTQKALPLQGASAVPPTPAPSIPTALSTWQRAPSAGAFTGSDSGQALFSWTAVLGGVYSLGFLILASRLWIGWRLGRQLVDASRPLAAPLLEPMCQDILGAARAARLQLRLAEQLVSPLCIGGRRPAILMPRLWQQWDENTRRAVLAHELHHLQRHDPLSHLGVLMTRCVYWFHPLSWWLTSHLSQLAERSCDLQAVPYARSPQTYARLLLQVVGDLRQPSRGIAPLALSMSGQQRLSQRIHCLLDRRQAPSAVKPLVSAAWGGSLLLATMLLGLVEVGRPVTAQEPEVEPEVLVATVHLSAPEPPRLDGVEPSLPLPDVLPAELQPIEIREPSPPLPRVVRSVGVEPNPRVAQDVVPAVEPKLVGVDVMTGGVVMPDVITVTVEPAVVGPAAVEPIVTPSVRVRPTEASEISVSPVDGGQHLELRPMPSTVTQTTTTVASLQAPVSTSMALSYPFALPREGQCGVDSDDAGFLILLFDDKNRAARSRPRADLSAPVQSELVRWIEHRLSPCDRVAVLSYQGRLRLHQDFTRDGASLLQAVAKAQKASPRSAVSAAPGDGDASLKEALTPQNLDRRRSIYKVLEELAQASGRLPGRTTVLMVTPGFDENNHFSEEFSSIARRGRAAQRLRKPIAAFKAAGTVVHVFNPWPMRERQGVQLLTEGTGGWYLFGFRAPMEEGVYSLK